jgi:cell wall-associated NlpC family hydrolase
MKTRREWLSLTGASLGFLLLSGRRNVNAADDRSYALDPGQFQSGDFLWPKKPGVFVPYDAGSRHAAEVDEAKWNEEHDRFVANMVAKAPYFTAVGIVEIDEAGVPWVIEALWERGVVRHTYADWAADRSGEVVWLGRLTKLSAAQRAKIPLEAKKHIGKPYDFWNFDLNDDAGFYCSKLAWMAVFRSLNLAVDGKSNPKRAFWFSPKQLLYVPRMARLIDPGPYATE